MKPIVILTALAVASPAYAGNVSNVSVVDRTKTVTETIPVTETVCNTVEVPIYETVKKQGNAAEGALAGMIIGGILGKGVTGKDDGAAAGAVIGGLIGADKGAKPKTEQRIVGYKQQRVCEDVQTYRDVTKQVYSHSIIKFKYDGFLYEVPFQK